MIIEIFSVLIVILCIIAPIYAFNKISKMRNGLLKKMLFTVSTALLFIAIAQALRLTFPLIQEPALSSIRVAYYIIHLIGDVFAIKAVIEFRNYSKLFTFINKNR